MKENDLIGGKTALEYAIEHVVPEHLAEVSRRLTPEERLGPHQVPQEVVAKFAAPRLRQIVCSLPQFIEQPRILDGAAVGRHHPLAFPRQLSSTNDILLSARYDEYDQSAALCDWGSTVSRNSPLGGHAAD